MQCVDARNLNKTLNSKLHEEKKRAQCHAVLLMDLHRNYACIAYARIFW